MYFEEVDWFWRLNLLGKKYSYADDTFVYHEGAGSTGKGIKYNTFLWRNQNTLQMLLKNYSSSTLLWVLPLYFLQNFIEILFFIFILKPKIAYSYIEGWWFNLVNLKSIFPKRLWIQRHRAIKDFVILSKMLIGSSKLLHLISFFRNS
jgi:GT2 family glycosyltransferase